MWPDVETRDILDEFTACIRVYIDTPDFFPHKKAAKRYMADAEDMMQELKSYGVPHREWKEFVSWAFEYHFKKKNLDGWTPKAIAYLVPRWRRRGHEEDTSRYLRGWFDD
jgi:hypothetical protein